MSLFLGTVHTARAFTYYPSLTFFLSYYLMYSEKIYKLYMIQMYLKMFVKISLHYDYYSLFFVIEILLVSCNSFDSVANNCPIEIA